MPKKLVYGKLISTNDNDKSHGAIATPQRSCKAGRTQHQKHYGHTNATPIELEQIWTHTAPMLWFERESKLAVSNFRRFWIGTLTSDASYRNMFCNSSIKMHLKYWYSIRNKMTYYFAAQHFQRTTLRSAQVWKIGDKRLRRLADTTTRWHCRKASCKKRTGRTTCSTY
jgi:hypothetical protein